MAAPSSSSTARAFSDIEEIYRQLQEFDNTPENGQSSNSMNRNNSEDAIYALYEESRPQPPPHPRSRPLPMPPGQQPKPPLDRTSYPPRGTSLANDPNVKRLPIVPGGSTPGLTPPDYPSERTSSPFGGYPPEKGYSERPYSPPSEKSRGAALYAEAMSQSRRPLPTSPRYQVPVIDVAPPSGSFADSFKGITGFNLGDTPPRNGGKAYQRSYQDSPSPPASGPAQFPIPDAPSKLAQDLYGRPLMGHTPRSMSTSSFGNNGYGAIGSPNFVDSPGEYTDQTQLLNTPSARPRFGVEDQDAENIGSSLLRSSSFASSVSGSSYPPAMSPVERMSLASQNSQKEAVTPRTGYQELSNPNGYPSDSGYNTISPQQYEYSSMVSPGTETSSLQNGGRYEEFDRPPSHSSRRMADDERLHERITDLKQRLGKLDLPLDDVGDDIMQGVPDDDGEFFDEEEDDSRFINLALLSHIAVRLRDKVPRGTHVKGSIPYPRAFTGKDIVSTIQSIIQRELLITLGISTNDRRIALQVARSLQNQLFFYEVEWGGRVLTDSVEDVYAFLDDDEDGVGGGLGGELPTGVITLLTKCYSPSCSEGGPCYSYGCPKRGQAPPQLLTMASTVEVPKTFKRGWKNTVAQELIDSLGPKEIRRQDIIFKMIEKEDQYIQDLDFIETHFIKALRTSNPPIIPLDYMDTFLDEVFGNILDLRETNKRLLEVLYVRQREQKPVITRIGDVFLHAAAEFRLPYPLYVGNLPLAEKRLKDEIDANPEFRLFLEQAARHPDARRLDLKHFITRPADHLRNYPILLEAAAKETDPENPDLEFLKEAASAINALSTMSTVRTFQSSMGRGPFGKMEWHEFVGKEILNSVDKKEAKRQNIIFELIKTEMEYVKDLESIDSLYIRPLRAANPPIIPRDRVNNFIMEAFYNYQEILVYHKRMLEAMHEIQRDEYPATLKHPDSRKLDMKAFAYRPIPRLLRYDLLMKGIMEASPPGHEDHDAIPQVLDIIKDLGKATEPGVTTAKQKVELWGYNANLVFKPGEAIDMDLLDETRTLVHTGKLLRQPDSTMEWSGWSELFVLLFDNYLVMTKPKEKDGITKYHVNRRPIPLELLSLVGFTELSQQRSNGFFPGRLGKDKDKDKDTGAHGGAGGDGAGDSRTVWPCSIHHTGRVGGLYQLFAESAAVRAEWKQKLEEAINLRNIVQESNKVFETRLLSEDTFAMPASIANPAYSGETPFTGKVTCSVPFSTSDGRGLVAIGCAEGVWIGLRNDKKSLRRVLHLKMVTQCAMLEDFGIFLVLADKSLFAYHIEALVPSSHNASAAGSRTPQKLNGTKDVQFFSVGTLNGRTLIIYMKKKGLDSVFRVLEPVIGKITEKSKNPTFSSRFLTGTSRSEWFRVYRDFFLPSESFDLVFLKAKIAILCTKGFEIMDLTDFKSVTIPQRDDPRLSSLARRCESCKPVGMFRSSENEFLLCYDEFGLYVDRHGDPNRGLNGVIEWEGTAERVAFHPPYVLIFDSRFIEVRHIQKGRLVQIIRGTDVRSIWDGRGASLPPLEGWDDGSSQEARVHAVMKAPDRQPNSKVAFQHVVELVPTVQLFVPPPLNSSESMTFYNGPNMSPPHSPRTAVPQGGGGGAGYGPMGNGYRW
ncbi:hypothetical protein FRC03_005538 [Tulasnella sp. 419]|nr:hypothetical protein FRC03_005538 [Tulasnella sp. 419]